MHDIQNVLFQGVGLHTRIAAHVELSKREEKEVKFINYKTGNIRNHNNH